MHDTTDIAREAQQRAKDTNGHKRVVPFKVVGKLVAATLDSDGRVIGEQIVGEVTLYEPQFDDLRAKVDEVWPQIEQQVR